MHRNEQRNWHRHWRHNQDTEVLGVAAFFLVVIALFAMLFVGMGITESNNNHPKTNQQLAERLLSDGTRASDSSEATATARKREAAELVKIAEDPSPLVALNANDAQVQEIREVAKTGRAFALSTEQQAIRGWLLFIVLLGILIWLNIVLFNYAYEADDQFLADLPWSKPWTWLYVALTAFPFGWLIFLVSAIRLRIWISQYSARQAAEQAQRERDQQERRLEHERREQRLRDRESVSSEQIEPEAAVEAAPPIRQGLPTYVSAPRIASETYREIRMTKWRGQLEKRLNKLRRKEEETKQSIVEKGQQIQELQRETGRIRTQMATVQAGLDENETITESRINEEFLRLWQLPGVVAVRVVDEGISLIIRATTEYEGTVYDLGDWELCFDASSSHLTTRKLRARINPSWRGQEPPYHNPGGDFCFGDRGSLVADHAKKGQFLEATAIAVECMNSVNEGHRRHIPSCYYPLEVEGN